MDGMAFEDNAYVLGEFEVKLYLSFLKLESLLNQLRAAFFVIV